MYNNTGHNKQLETNMHSFIQSFMYHDLHTAMALSVTQNFHACIHI